MDTTNEILGEMSDQLYEIRNTLDYGFELIGTKLDLVNSSLGEVVNLLKSPLTVQVDEYLRRGIKSLGNEWYEDALNDFETARSMHPQSYLAPYYIGVIKLEYEGKTDEALDALKISEKYSKPDSKFYYSSSIYQQALIYRLNGDDSRAFSLSLKAHQADKRNTIALFLFAEVAADLNKPEECLKAMRYLEAQDLIFFLRAKDSLSLRNYKPVVDFFRSKTEDYRNFNSKNSADVDKVYKRLASLSEMKNFDIDANIFMRDFKPFQKHDEFKIDYLVQRVIKTEFPRKIKDWKDNLEKQEKAVKDYSDYRGLKYAAGKEYTFLGELGGNDEKWALVGIGMAIISFILFGMDIFSSSENLFFSLIELVFKGGFLSIIIGIVAAYICYFFQRRLKAIETNNDNRAKRELKKVYDENFRQLEEIGKILEA